MSKNNVTRGYGVLEKFLSEKRCRVANKLIPFSYRNGLLLDIGCGAYPLFLISTEFSKKYGMDKIVRDDYKEHLKEHDITLVICDIEKEDIMPFSNELFDVVTMLAVFVHLEPLRLTKILQEIYRILKHNGIYILTTPAPWADGLLRVMARLRLVSPVEIGEHKDAYSHSKISFLLQKANFSKEKLRQGYFEMFMNIWGTAIK